MGQLPRRADARFFPKSLESAYVQRIFAECGYNKAIDGRDRVNRISAYTFRHSYSTQALEAGANVKDVQAMLGHDSLDSTMVYVHQINDAAQRGQATLAKALGDTEQSEVPSEARQEKLELKIIERGK